MLQTLDSPESPTRLKSQCRPTTLKKTDPNTQKVLSLVPHTWMKHFEVRTGHMTQSGLSWTKTSSHALVSEVLMPITCLFGELSLFRNFKFKAFCIHLRLFRYQIQNFIMLSGKEAAFTWLSLGLSISLVNFWVGIANLAIDKSFNERTHWDSLIEKPSQVSSSNGKLLRVTSFVPKRIVWFKISIPSHLTLLTLHHICHTDSFRFSLFLYELMFDKFRPHQRVCFKNETGLLLKGFTMVATEYHANFVLFRFDPSLGSPVEIPWVLFLLEFVTLFGEEREREGVRPHFHKPIWCSVTQYWRFFVQSDRWFTFSKFVLLAQKNLHKQNLSKFRIISTFKPKNWIWLDCWLLVSD